ncbi:hypothetical protein EDB89DRAFT_66723 [Lactarius sanguifluus]|nr:hypothetical protein EDB89DRAFT_66723 [Lactarius sanguifluus]
MSLSSTTNDLLPPLQTPLTHFSPHAPLSVFCLIGFLHVRGAIRSCGRSRSKRRGEVLHVGLREVPGSGNWVVISQEREDVALAQHETRTYKFRKSASQSNDGQFTHQVHEEELISASEKISHFKHDHNLESTGGTRFQTNHAHERTRIVDIAICKTSKDFCLRYSDVGTLTGLYDGQGLVSARSRLGRGVVVLLLDPLSNNVNQI